VTGGRDPMEAHPFFSVVIPTKNRPGLLRDAVHSAVWQEFDDYEVIVSDNCNDEKTRQAIDPFLGQGRLRYVRTDAELPMPDHWEFATTHARGRYVLVLTDRSVLTPRALATIHRVLLSRGEQIAVCSWRWSLYDDARRTLLGDLGGADRGEAAVVESVSVARAFVDKSGPFPYAVPRGLNSCYRDDLGQRIRNRFGRLFWPVNPDFTSAFLLLAHTPEVVHIDEALFVSQGLRVSNGGRGVASTCLPYLETLGITDFYAHVPIKAPIVENVIFNDFISVKTRARGYLEGVNVDWVEYFVACYRELLEKKGAGLAGAPALDGMVAEWERALAGCDPATREAVKTRVSRLRTLRMKMLVKASPLGPFLVGLKRYVGASRPRGLRRRHGPGSALAAAGFRPQVPS
jgi:hypothetical protein